PLNSLKTEKNIDVTYVDGENESAILNGFEKSIQQTTKLIAITHASNVTGTIMPLKGICKIAKKHQITVLVDASQTAGHINIHMQQDGIDILAFPGHKGMLGP